MAGSGDGRPAGPPTAPRGSYTGPARRSRSQSRRPEPPTPTRPADACLRAWGEPRLAGPAAPGPAAPAVSAPAVSSATSPSPAPPPTPTAPSMPPTTPSTTATVPRSSAASSARTPPTSPSASSRATSRADDRLRGGDRRRDADVLTPNRDRRGHLPRRPTNRLEIDEYLDRGRAAPGR